MIFLDGRNLPFDYDKEEFEKLNCGKKISQSKALVVIGIGGSYLGAKSCY